MNIFKYVATVLLLTACQREQNIKYASLPISITTPQSKAMGKRSFVPDDTIALYQWTSIGRSVERGDFIYDGTQWLNHSSLVWTTVDTPHFFISMYPKTEIVFDAEHNSTIRYDIAKDSALLCARVLAPGRVTTQGAVPLEFLFLASRLVIDLQYGGGFLVEPKVLSLKLKSIGTVAEQFSLTADIISGDLSDFQDVLLYRTNQGQSYVAHIIPQQISELELVLDYNGKKLMYQKRVLLTLESGSTYNLKFRIDL